MAKKALKRLLVLSACALPLSWVAAEDGIFDPPAVTVKIEHEEIGKSLTLDDVVGLGREFFLAKFNILDGAGRPLATGDSKPTPRMEPGPTFQRISGPDANSCAGCHNLPAIGGGGDIAANVFFGAHFADPIVWSIDGKFSNERHSPSLFGSGLVETAAAEISQELHGLRSAAIAQARNLETVVELPLLAKGVSFGTIIAHEDGYVDYRRLEGIDNDLIVKPFGVKGIAISLREFTISALNHHHGIQSIERFGWERTGRVDFDGDGIEEEFSAGQLSALTLFQATLPPPNAPSAHDAGLRIFNDIGCASCHIPSLTVSSSSYSEPNKFNRPGTLTPAYTENVVKYDISKFVGADRKVWFFSDFRRHNMCDSNQNRLCNEELIQDNVPRNLFMTARLWDLRTSAPYCHRGDCPTVTDAILAHGGEGAASVRNFRLLAIEDKRKLIGYLLTLGEN